MNKHSIANQIAHFRTRKKMTQEEFATRLGVTPQAVSKWECGNGMPDILLLEGICQILDISADVLLGIAKNNVVENGNLYYEQEIKNNLLAEPLLVEFGKAFLSCVEQGLKTDIVNRHRKHLAKKTGKLIPIFHIQDNFELGEREYRIISYGKVLWQENVRQNLDDEFEYIIGKVETVCNDNYGELLNKHIVKLLVDNLKHKFPGIADGLVPEKISYLQLERELQKRLEHGENICDLIHILEDMEGNMTCTII